ncbi:MAG: DegV family protein [Lachnospiraceae bacterium]|nr:DegV family protein [Lachnospiraceae bacterium]
MRIAVMTDTNSGISVKEAEDMGIFCMPMPVIINEDNYIEGVNLTQEKFFELLSSDVNISTSQPSPGDLMKLWDDIIAKGYDEIIYIPMSSGLSSSTNNARIFAEDYPGKVFIADNHRISVTQRQSVMDAVFLASIGWDAESIRGELERTAYDSVVYLAVEDLGYLKKTGRVNATAATVGNVLGIKPILRTTGETFEVRTAVRGIKKAAARIIEEVNNELDTRFKGIDPEDIVMGTAGSFVNPEDAHNWCATVKEAFPDIEVYYNSLSCSISSHTGPNAMGIGISKKVRL